MGMDLEYNRYPDFATLAGLLPTAWPAWSASCPRASSATPTRARWSTRRTLGLAFQLTNIIRDVGEDVRRNRIYLPLDELARFGLTADDLVALKEDERFARLMTFQIARAREHYARAFALLPRSRPQEPAPGPGDGRHLSHAARRDRGIRRPACSTSASR